MSEFGTTETHLAEVAVAARAWANLNADACMFGQGDLTHEDCISPRMVYAPLRKTD